MADPLYQPGEIVPQCGTTLDVYVREGESVTLGGLPEAEWPASRIVQKDTTDGVTCYRLALWAGDRLKVQSQIGACHWQQDADSGAWQTDCGVTFDFIDDGPAENKMHFCYYCGRRLVVDVKTWEQP